MGINPLSLFIAAAIPMVLGAIWFSPRVLGSWVGNTNNDGKGHGPMTYVGSFVFCLMLAFIMNLIAVHDSWIQGALYYLNHGGAPEPGSESAKWLAFYNDNLMASNHTFKHGAFHGFLISGLFIALPIVANNALYSGRGWKYIVANASYWIACLSLMGGVVAAMA